MTDSNHEHGAGPGEDESWVLSSLEYDQLVEAKKKPYCRRTLKGPELVVVWALRLYLIFMMTAVVVQILHSGH